MNGKLIILVVILCFNHLFAQGQNLVRNGSFEKYYICPDSYTVDYTKRFLPNWVMPTRGTPDYFNRCSRETVGVPQNFMGSIFPADGSGFIGLVLLDTPDVKEEIDYRDYVRSGPLMPVTITNANVKKPNTKRTAKPINYREYVQTQLISPLQRNQLYRISFKYALAQHSTFVSNRLGVLFTENPVSAKKGVLPYTPQVAIDTVVLFATPGIWVEFADTFRLKTGGEMYLTIGNFYDDSGVRYLVNDISSLNKTLQKSILTNQVAYYYIDDIKVEPVSSGSMGALSPKYLPLSMIPKKDFFKISASSRYYALLDEVFFDIGQPGSSPNSFCQLKTLADYLRQNEHLEVELQGLLHEVESDTLGAAARIGALCDYLKEQGISGNRLKSGVEQDLKAIANTYRFYREGLPCALHASLIAIRFYQLN